MDALVIVYPKGTKEEIQEIFPDKSWEQIRRKAQKMALTLSCQATKHKRHGGCWKQTPASRIPWRKHHVDMLKLHGMFCEVCGDWIAGKDKLICLDCEEKLS